MTREIGCQTEPVISRSAGVQANLKPMRRSKGDFEYYMELLYVSSCSQDYIILFCIFAAY